MTRVPLVGDWRGEWIYDACCGAVTCYGAVSRLCCGAVSRPSHGFGPRSPAGRVWTGEETFGRECVRVGRPGHNRASGRRLAQPDLKDFLPTCKGEIDK